VFYSVPSTKSIFFSKSSNLRIKVFEFHKDEVKIIKTTSQNISLHLYIQLRLSLPIPKMSDYYQYNTIPIPAEAHLSLLEI